MVEAASGQGGKALKFIDLFAGLGGFHEGLARLGHKCVFACELNADLRDIYKKNHGIMPHDDIRTAEVEKIPAHDILCAGFPCQPFSKAGEQEGFDCPKWGDLFGHVMRIIHHHEPPYVILENVPNLARHNGGDTWLKIQESLKKAGYVVDIKKLSPHRFGIPQVRERVFIVATRDGLDGFSWPNEVDDKALSIMSVLDEKTPLDAKAISKQSIDCLEVWQEFISHFPKDEELPSFPIWSMEFGATYPYEDETPHAAGELRLGRYYGSHGSKLSELPKGQRLAALPSHGRTAEPKFPEWKIQFIRQNRELYLRHKVWMDKWIPLILQFPPSLQKLEWNCNGEKRDVWKYIIQFRASGVRLKRPTTAPALIAMTTTQVPIIGWEKRYMTPRECSRLQSMGGLQYLPTTPTKAYKALGNAVNARVIELIAKNLLSEVRIETLRAEKAWAEQSQATASCF